MTETEVRRAQRPLRVIQWTTGNVARQTVRAVLARDDLELVGAFAYSPEKVGRDVAELVGLEEPVGVTATDDVEHLLALRPDCVVYSSLFPNVEELSRLLRAGVNVVTSSAFLTGRSLGDVARNEIEAAAQAGNATIFDSGMNPGYTQLLAAVAAGASAHVRRVKVTESVDVAMFAPDANMDDLGWGRPADSPGGDRGRPRRRRAPPTMGDEFPYRTGVERRTRVRRRGGWRPEDPNEDGHLACAGGPRFDDHRGLPRHRHDDHRSTRRQCDSGVLCGSPRHPHVCRPARDHCKT